MACPNYKRIENKNLYHWSEVVGGREGYTIAPVITIRLRAHSTITLAIDSDRKDWLELKTSPYVTVLEPFIGEKEFQFKIKVNMDRELISEADLEELPITEMPIPLPGDDGPPRIYKVKEHRLWPYIQILIKITGKDDKEPVCEESIRFALTNYVEVIS